MQGLYNAEHNTPRFNGPSNLAECGRKKLRWYRYNEDRRAGSRLGKIRRRMEVWRKNVVWGTFMAGSAGVELYIGKGDDLRVQDYRPFEKHYQTAVRAIRFLSDHTAFQVLEPHEDFADSAWTLLEEGETYLLYLTDGGTTEVKLPKGEYSAHWFDPRNGGDLQRGSKKSLSGGNSTSIGNPPNSNDEDWICLIRKN